MTFRQRRFFFRAIKAQRFMITWRNQVLVDVFHMPEKKMGHRLRQDRRIAKRKIERIYMAIKSCKNAEQIATAHRMIDLFWEKHQDFPAEVMLMRKELVHQQEEMLEEHIINSQKLTYA
jgi:hypothetical protein